MKALLIEDEYAAAQNLAALLREVEPEIEILEILESIEEAVEWIGANPAPDLGFFDIQLADGPSFNIFEQTRVDFPVIFATAYDQYAIKAFQVNSVDYLLKPVSADAVRKALIKFKKHYSHPEPDRAPPTKNDRETILKVIAELGLLPGKQYKSTFLVHHRNKLLPIEIDSFSYFYISDGNVMGMTRNSQSYLMDQKLESLEADLDPKVFFRANRQYLVARQAITEAEFYFNGRLALHLHPKTPDLVLISKARVPAFKNWMNT